MIGMRDRDSAIAGEDPIGRPRALIGVGSKGRAGSTLTVAILDGIAHNTHAIRLRLQISSKMTPPEQR
jgi:hypothetical protein